MNETNDAPAEDDPLKEFPRTSKPWLDAIEDAKKYVQLYNDKCDNIDKLYADLEQLSKQRTDREFQIFWANLEVLKPSVYSRPPVPVVVPKFKDNAELPRQASEVLERTLSISFDLEDIDQTMRAIRDDMAINARGVPWLRYEAEEADDGSVKEAVRYDHIDRKDFLHEPARKWKEVGWVARREWIAVDAGVKRFGDNFTSCQFEQQKIDDKQTYQGEKKAQVWELWSKTKGVVVWVSPGVAEVLDIQRAWLQLRDFYPCPRPAYGTLQRGSLIPVPDFVYYRDQVEEVNELTARISALCERLKVKGFYPAGQEDVSNAIERAIKDTDNGATLVPVPGFAIMGGASLDKFIVWLPVNEIAAVVKELIINRRQLIDDIYQITGLSDIMRGQTDANETLGAQELKSQYGSVRIRDRQAELVRIARDMTRMAGEIIAENFQPKTLLEMSQIKLPTDEQVKQQLTQMEQQALAAGQPFQPPAKMPVTLDQIIALFRSDKIRPFVLDIETDSTIQPDENTEKQRRTEFLTAVGGFFQQALPLVQSVPEAATVATEMLKYVAAGFRAGRPLEGAIDDFAEKVKQKASQPPPPNPEHAKMQQDMAIEKDRAQADIQIKQLEAQIKTIELEIKKLDGQAKLAEAQASMNQPAEAPEPFAADQAVADIRKTLAEVEKIKAEVEKLRTDTAMAPLQALQSADHAERQMVISERPGPEPVNG